jgi:2-polyprenyl-3-methyl-5-hydroxy-6-metoxy-1,4-benzoquinol methylase
VVGARTTRHRRSRAGTSPALGQGRVGATRREHALERHRAPSDKTASATDVRYAYSASAWGEQDAIIRDLVAREGVHRICDVGGGANPLLSLDFVEANTLDYVVLDISGEELDKAPDGYVKFEADVCSQGFSAGEPFDLVFSRFVAEHVRRPDVFHRNLHGALVDGGYAVHFFPTLWALPFVLNCVLVERLAKYLFLRIQPHRAHSKFPAYYRSCRGPTRRQRERLEGAGFQVERYVGYFGHGYYETVSPLQAAENALAHALVRHPVPALTAYGLVVLRRRG